MSYPNKMLCLDVVTFSSSIMGTPCILLDEQPVMVDGKTMLYRVGIRPNDSAARENLRIYAQMQSGQYHLTAITDPLDPVRSRTVDYGPEDLTDFIEILPASLQ